MSSQDSQTRKSASLTTCPTRRDCIRPWRHSHSDVTLERGSEHEGSIGLLTLPDKPGLGIDDVVDEVISQHLQPHATGIWQTTDRWNDEYSWDRTWS